jgi:hypothetical protein
LSFATYSKERLHPDHFIHAYTTALLHHKTIKGLELPSPVQIFPSKFFNANVFYQIQQDIEFKEKKANKLDTVYSPEPTATNFDPEHRLWYFREDIGVNSHHFFWHCVYPGSNDGTDGDGIVDKDRRGELFYYMHQQVG